MRRTLRRTRIWPHASRWVCRGVVPVSVSLAMHGLAAGVLLMEPWGAGSRGGQGRAAAELVMTLPPPEPARDAASAPSSSSSWTLAPAGSAGAPPSLHGLASPIAPAAPTLRSASSELPLVFDRLRRRDEEGGLASFAGLGARRAGSVVYVVDASGAMVSSLRFVLEELQRSVWALSPAQRFAVVLFRERADTGSSYEEFVAPGFEGGAALVPATAANKEALARWLGAVRPAGRSNPLPGLRRGLEFQPDVIFLLSRSIPRSDGAAGTGVWGAGTPQILAELERLNPRDSAGRRRTVIKAIQFLEEDPTGTMRAIGQEHGEGPDSYTILTLQALNQATGRGR